MFISWMKCSSLLSWTESSYSESTCSEDDSDEDSDGDSEGCDDDYKKYILDYMQNESTDDESTDDSVYKSEDDPDYEPEDDQDYDTDEIWKLTNKYLHSRRNLLMQIITC